MTIVNGGETNPETILKVGLNLAILGMNPKGYFTKYFVRGLKISKRYESNKYWVNKILEEH